MSKPGIVRGVASAALCGVALVLGGCATLAEGGGGDEGLPNASAGPFRKLAEGELGNSRSAPNALLDKDTFPRDPAVVDLDGDPATLAVAGYFAASAEGQPATSPPRAILRHGALDARSFDRSGDVVLEPSEPWEGDSIGAPSALRVGDEIWVYYTAAGGIGLARSADGLSFTREPGPVLAPDTEGWEQGGVPASPGVARLWDGSFRMFYEVPAGGGGGATAGARIGEARSDDGIAWTRVGDGPALAPAPAVPGTSEADLPFDGASVGSPFPVTAISAAGERILRVYYGARSQSGLASVGLAARFGADAPLERAVSPVFGAGSSLEAREPCVVIYGGFSLLFATQRADIGEDDLAVAAGVAPGTAVLPPPNPR